MSLGPAWLRSRQPPEPQRLSPTRIKLMILLPLTISLLVGATGFVALNMARRAIALQGSHTTELVRMSDQIFVQVLLIAVIAAILGIGLEVGVTTPLRALADKLEAVASGDLSTSFDAKSAPESEQVAVERVVREIASFARLGLGERRVTVLLTETTRSS